MRGAIRDRVRMTRASAENPDIAGTVVVLRAVNVGGHGTLKVKELADRLADLEVVNVGAAGTFAVRARASPRAVRDAFVREVGVPTNVIVRSGSEFARLWRRRPNAWAASELAEKRFVTFLSGAQVRTPRFPHLVPDTGPWELRLDALVGADVLSSWRPVGDRRNYYANEVVERQFGVPATTRGWDTLEKVRALLEPTGPASRAPRNRSRRRAPT